MEKKLVGKCGLYCGACTIYRAERDGDTLREKLANQFNCSKDQVRCNGCGDLTSECWGNGCKIVVCLRSKGHNYCYECGNFQDCEKYEKLAKSYLEAGVDLRRNLGKIKDGYTEEWLNEQQELFKCPSCNHAVSAWFTKCHMCGKSLK